MDNKICYECKQGMFYNSLPTLECIKCQNTHRFNNRTNRQQKQPDKEQAITDKDNNRSYKNDQFDHDNHISNIISDSCILMSICGLM